MQQNGEYRITAPRQQVWQALNDPQVLARCIEGCQSMERIADDRFNASVKAKVGPVSAIFQAELTLADINPPSSYTLNAGVKGGAAGFAKGSARVDLADEGQVTLLRYAVQGNVGGKLAQVGSRLIDGAARKMADDFFAAFGREVGGTEPSAPVAPAAPAGTGQWKIWAVVFAVLILAVILAM